MSSFTELKKWWKKNQQQQHQQHQAIFISSSSSQSSSSVFGSPLQDSLQLASVAISVLGPDQKPYVYGFIPLVVAKCALYLKQHATLTQGIFRISGSTKRIKQLQALFDLPPLYGKDIQWFDSTTPPTPHQSLKPYFSIHDAANLLRRYLMCLPEPIINQSMYQDLCQVLNKHAGDKVRQIGLFKSLISTLSPSTQYLLLYLLDLLAVFASRAEQNLMTANNLAVVFQPALCPASPTTQADLDRIIYAPPAAQPAPADRSALQQESLLEQQSIMRHVKQAQAVVEFMIVHQGQFLSPLPRPIRGPADDLKVLDRSSCEWGTMSDEAGATPRPTSYAPAGSAGRRRSSTLQRSHTLPQNAGAVAKPLGWAAAMDQLVGSPVPIAAHQPLPHYLPPQIPPPAQQLPNPVNS